MVAKLVEALSEVEGLAKRSGKRARKGAGGIPAKARWYQIMASIAQTLDHVLRSEDLDAIQARMLEMEKTIDELQRTTPQTG